MDSVEEAEMKHRKVYNFYADITVHIANGGLIKEVGVSFKADCFERMLEEVHYYRKMFMAKNYTHRYSDFLYEGKKCTCESEFLDIIKDHHNKWRDRKTSKTYPTFTVDSFVYLRDNTVGWQKFIPDEFRDSYLDVNHY